MSFLETGPYYRFNAVAVSPTSFIFAAHVDDGKHLREREGIVLFDISSPRKITTRKLEAASVLRSRLRFIDEGRIAYNGFHSLDVLEWKSQKVTRFRLNQSVNGWSTDLRYALGDGFPDNRNVLYDLQAGKAVSIFPGKKVRLSGERALVATADDEAVRLYQLATRN